MKRFLCFVLLLTVLFSAACTADGDGSDSDSSSALPVGGTVSDDADSAEESRYAIVPSIDGMSSDEAKETLTAAGFTVAFVYKNYDDVAKGDVAGMDAEVGAELETDTKICVYVSEGKSLAGQSLDYKQSALVESREELPQGANNDYVPLNYDTVRAVWLSQYDMEGLYKNGSIQRDEDDFRIKVRALFQGLADIGFNTLYVQLRPNGDSFYPSAYYCPSKYVTGAYTTDFKYDPLKIMVEEAHAVSLSFHGWINPLRCMEPSNLSLMNVSYGLRKFEQDGYYGDYIFENGTLMYLNPGREAARQLIIDGAAEIVRYYDVDGIHIDDYFYPGSAEDHYDELAFKDQTEYLSYASFRKVSLSLLVSGIYSAVKSENSNVLFGVSPAGNLSNVRAAGADIDKWLSTEGYLDYVAPQIYWGLENGRHSFDTVYLQWTALEKHEGVKLIVGMTLSYAADPDDEWAEHKDVLKRCYEFANGVGNCDGFSLFSSQYVIGSVSAERTSVTAEEIDNLFEYADDAA